MRTYVLVLVEMFVLMIVLMTASCTCEASSYEKPREGKLFPFMAHFWVHDQSDLQRFSEDFGRGRFMGIGRY